MDFKRTSRRFFGKLWHTKTRNHRKEHTAMPGKHLTITERATIQILRKQNMNPKQIAKELRRATSTITRELNRNGQSSGYDAERAQRKYIQRREACRPANKLGHQPLRGYVVTKIRDEEWTPEQVANRLPIEYPNDSRMRISHEAIYQAIYTQDSLHFLIGSLPQSRPKRRKRGQGKSRRGPSIPNRIGIEQRPPEVDTRTLIGHWEGDTVIGKNNDGFIVTLVERSSRILHAVITSSKETVEVVGAVVETLLDRPPSWLKTITFDNGTEFASHQTIKEKLGMDIYFAAPYSAYQRGTNENTNGLIRRFLPKQTSFKALTQSQLDDIVHKINNRPRKCLGYRTPCEVFQEIRKQNLCALRT